MSARFPLSGEVWRFEGRVYVAENARNDEHHGRVFDARCIEPGRATFVSTLGADMAHYVAANVAEYEALSKPPADTRTVTDEPEPRGALVALPRPTPAPVDPEMVETLEVLLARCRAGEVAGLLVVWERRDGGSCYRAVHESGSRPCILIGETAIALQRMTSRLSG